MKFRIFNVIVYLSGIMVMVLPGCSDRNKPAKAPVEVVSENYYGVNVDDPYRYMEDMDDTVFLDWMKEYSNYSRDILDRISGRSDLVETFRDFDSRKSDKIYGLRIAENGRYFYLKITPEDEFGKLYYRDSYQGEEQLLYNPVDFSDDPDISYVIGNLVPDNSGQKVAVLLAPNGSESYSMVIIDVASGKVLEDRITQVFGSVSWLADDETIIYGKTNSADIHDPKRLLDIKVYMHQLGEAQSNDRIIYSSLMYPGINARPEEIPYILYDNDEGDYYLLLSTVERYIKLYRSAGADFSGNLPFEWYPLIRKSDEVQNFYVKGNELYLYTAKDAPGFEILRTNKLSPDIQNAEVIVPENGLGMISGFAFTNEALYYKLKINGVQERLFKLAEGAISPEEITLPARAGSLTLSTRGHNFSDIWVYITGWTTDGVRYRYNQSENSFAHEPLSSVATFPEFDNLVVKIAMVTSHDGTEVPLSIIHSKELKLDGSPRLMMTGYGAYGIARTPSFSPYMLSWVLKGGVFAVAHVRGGGELGDAWRLGGHKASKPNTWKDFISCAEYLVDEGYTSPPRLSMYGGSAGGILVGRTMTERPDLFAVAITIAGAMNTLRLEQSPNGPVNAPEFGTVKDSAECMALIEMDSYLHIRDGVEYPATLITAGFNDPRIIIWQPAKFAARLQAANGSREPILFDVDYSSGHGVGDAKTKQFRGLADIYSFALWQTGHPDFKLESKK